MPKHSSGIIEVKRFTASDFLTNIAVIISLLLLILGTIGLVVLPKILSSRSFDDQSRAAEVKQCNEVCRSNNECEANYFCYSGHCRYALNPESEVCSTTPPSPTPSPLPTPSPSSQPKGGAVATLSASPTTQPPLVATNSESGMVSGTPEPATPAGFVRRDSTPDSTVAPSSTPAPEDETAMESVLGYLTEMGVPVNILPYLAIGVGVAILIIIVIWKLLSNNRAGNRAGGIGGRGRKQQPTQKLETAEYEQNLQQKLDQLKQNTPPPAASQSTMVPPQTTPRPTQAQTQPVQVPQQQVPQAQTQPAPTPQPSARPAPQPPTQTQAQPAPPTQGSSMLERVRQKGIRIPGSTAQPETPPKDSNQ